MEHLPFKKILLGFFVGLLVSMNAVRPALSTEANLKPIAGCLSKPLPLMDVKYQFSAAAIVDLKNGDPWRWYLVRIRTNQDRAAVPQYNVIAVNRKSRCINFTPIPNPYPELSKYTPPQVSAKFKAIIDQDGAATEKAVSDRIRQNFSSIRKYFPDKSDQELWQIINRPLD